MNLINCQSQPATLTVGAKAQLSCSTDGLSITPQSVVLFKDTSKAEPFTIEFLDKPVIAAGNISQTFTSYRVGNHDLEGLTLVVDDKVYPLSKQNLQVQSVIPQTGAEPTPFPLVEPVEVPIPWWWWAIWIGLFLALATWGVIAFLRWQKARRLAALAKVQARPLTPAEKFRSRMRKLDSHGYHQKGEFKAFALELTNILKSALGEVYGFPAEDLTSEELIIILQQKYKPFYKASGVDVQNLFSELDQIKFAKVQTSSDRCVALMDLTLNIGRKLFGEAS